MKKKEIKENTQKSPESTAPTTRAELVSFAFEVGSAIALPLVIFALSGRMLDKQFDTSPLYLIIGLLLSLVSTGIIIWKKVKTFV